MEPLTDEFYLLFKRFYYDSYQITLEVIGNENVTLSLEDFSKLSLESQYNICSVGMDYALFYSTMLKAVVELLKGKPLGSLLIRTFSDLSGISWDFRRELSNNEKDRIRQMKHFFENDVQLNIGNINEKNLYCLDNRLMKKRGMYSFVEGYASVPMEFQMKDLYISNIPLIQWLQENLPDSDEKDRLQIMAESLERKYSII